MSNRLFLSPPHMSGREQDYIKEVFRSNYLAPVGEFLKRFEESITKATGAKYALALNSATAGLHLALRVLGIKEGDIVLASSFTFIGSIDGVLYQGATPYFIDSNESWNLSPELLKEAIATSPKKPKALILTHLYGQMAKIDEIKEICKSEEIFLIEDAAEALGAKFRGKDAGTFGDLGVYSFNGNKILTTSGGGVLVSDNREWIDKALYYSTQAKEPKIYYEHKDFGYNYRMSNLIASIGVAQMEVLDKRVARRREIFKTYQELLSDYESEIEWMPEIEGSFGNRWLTTLTFKSKNPFELIKLLEEDNIESRPLWKPMHLQPIFKDSLKMVDGTSEELFNRGICLPSGSSMSDEDIKRVVNIIRKWIEC